MRVLIDVEYGRELYFWDIDVANDQELIDIFEAHKPTSCLDEVSVLPGKLTLLPEEPTIPYDWYVLWHEADDSFISPFCENKLIEKPKTDIELLFETLNDAMIRIEQLEESINKGES